MMMRRPGLIPALGWVILAVACGEPQSPSTVHIATAIGEQHDGTYNLGPVALHGSFWNSCSPYAPELEASLGENLAGLALAYNGDGSLCDTCVTLKRANGKQVTARVITTGETVGQNDIDLSQKAFEALGGDDYPRRMTWALVKCPNSGGSGTPPLLDQASLDGIESQCTSAAGDPTTLLQCDFLFFESEAGSAQQDVGASCGGTQDGANGSCGTTSDSGSTVDSLIASCGGGDNAACDELFFITPVGSKLELFGTTCGGRSQDELAGSCETTLG